MNDFNRRIAEGKASPVDVVAGLRNFSKDSIRKVLDGMVADAIVILMDGGNTPANRVKSERLSYMVDFVATELLPGYDKLRKPTQIASGNNQRNTANGNEFRSCLLIQDDKQDELLNKLHLLIDGKKGKAVALVIHLCVELGLMSKPSFRVLKVEFPGIGNKSGYNTPYREFETRYPKEEIDGMKANLITFQEYI